MLIFRWMLSITFIFIGMPPIRRICSVCCVRLVRRRRLGERGSEDSCVFEKLFFDFAEVLFGYAEI